MLIISVFISLISNCRVGDNIRIYETGGGFPLMRACVRVRACVRAAVRACVRILFINTRRSVS